MVTGHPRSPIFKSSLRGTHLRKTLKNGWPRVTGDQIIKTQNPKTTKLHIINYLRLLLGLNHWNEYYFRHWLIILGLWRVIYRVYSLGLISLNFLHILCLNRPTLLYPSHYVQTEHIFFAYYIRAKTLHSIRQTKHNFFLIILGNFALI